MEFFDVSQILDGFSFVAYSNARSNELNKEVEWYEDSISASIPFVNLTIEKVEHNGDFESQWFTFLFVRLRSYYELGDKFSNEFIVQIEDNG